MKVKELPIKKPVTDVSKELEIINFRLLQEYQGDSQPEWKVNSWMQDVEFNEQNLNQKVPSSNIRINQFTSFQKAMKMLNIVGQLIGLNPVIGILKTDMSKIRFSLFSMKFLYSLILGIFQMIITYLWAYELLSTKLSIGVLAFLSFYLTSVCNTIMFMRIATKWPDMLKELLISNLHSYVDPHIAKKCNLACFAFLAAATVEHILSIISRLARLSDCQRPWTDFISELTNILAPSLDCGSPYDEIIGAFLTLINIISTINWNYSDMFIVCISLYLSSILEQLNKKIAIAADQSYLPSSVWSSLREDYTRATRLVQLFDNRFSCIILVSFANNLFFICLQLFNVLVIGVQFSDMGSKKCPNYPSGPFGGFEFQVYMSFSIGFLVWRFLAVALVAASVHSASVRPAPLMYNIPTSAYTKEVQRFLEQVHGDTVALSGLQFFYITRELVLAVAGTIVTYELVLLQFSGDSFKE